MVHGTTKPKYEKNARRISPNKDGSKKRSISFIEKRNNSEQPEKLSEVEKDSLQEDDLLTPEFILKTYANKKNNATAIPKRSTSLDDLNVTKQTGNIGILELLSKKEEDLRKITQEVENQRNFSTPMEVPVKYVKPFKTPPSTPPKKLTASERFAGLSNSPAPSNLPLPSFSFLDQELSKGKEIELPLSLPKNGYQPSNRPPLSHSPPSNPHLETMTNQLRMMLNIGASMQS